jgi:signal transduction histidine kinase/ABC-type amino acid transport substrate-binding protein/BarA-like signal transduction histidine kinase
MNQHTHFQQTQHFPYSFRQLVFLMLIFSFTFSIFCPSVTTSAAETSSEQKTVTVGYYLKKDFQEGMGDDKPKSGYSYEYLQKIASYTGWHYKYVYGDWNQLYKKLVSGQIDMLAGVAYTKERSKLIDFPDYDMCQETFYIYKDASDNSMQCGNISSYSGKKIGVVKNSMMSSYLNTWFSKTHAKADVIYYDYFSDCSSDFYNKKIDAFVSADNIVSSYTGVFPVEKLGKEPYYLAVAKGDKNLLNELNMSLSLIDGQDGLFFNELKNKYSSDTSVKIYLSDKELQWIENHNSITIGYLKNYLPYCDEDKDGKVTGLISEIIPAIFSSLPGSYNLDFIYKSYDIHEDLFAGLRNGDVDVIFPIGGEIYYTEQEGFLQSSTIYTATMDLAYTGKYSFFLTEKIAVNKNNLLQYYYTIHNYPTAQIVDCKSIEECIQAVKSGKASSTIINGLRAPGLLNSETKLNIVPLKRLEPHCFGVTSNNTGLLQLLNQGISLIGEEYSTNAVCKYMDSLVSYTAKDFIKDNIAVFIGILIVFFIVIAALIIKRNIRLRETAEKELLQNQALEKALEEAHIANQTKTAFLNNMSHDIRTPLNGIIGIIDINSKSTDVELIEENRQKARCAAQQLLSLLNEVLDMSRLEHGETVLTNELFNLSELTAVLQDTMQIHAAESGIILICDSYTVPSNCEWVYGSPIYIQKIFFNIIENAIKYNKTGGQIRWKTELIEQTESTLTCKYTISDTGVGMNEEYLSHVFEPFSQETGGARTKYQGVGLGLSITKSLVEQMKGTIDVSSEVGLGTTITIILPFTIANAQKNSSTHGNGNAYHLNNDEFTPSISDEDITAASLSGKQILLVEDNELNLEIAQFMLEDAGIIVTPVKDGSQALEAFLEKPAGNYDMILMDIMMPVMNGYEATRAIRASGRKDALTIPIISVTANAYEEDRQASFAAGMNEHLTKPLNCEKLIATIVKFL